MLIDVLNHAELGLGALLVVHQYRSPAVTVKITDYDLLL